MGGEAGRHRSATAAPLQRHRRHRLRIRRDEDQVGTQCELTRQDLAVISTRDVERREANWRASMGVQGSVDSYTSVGIGEEADA